MNPKHGRILIYVWAIEQDELSKRAIPVAETGTREPNQADAHSSSQQGQDVFVPWVLTGSKAREGSREKRAKDKDRSAHVTDEVVEPPFQQRQRFERYYHMFAEGELVDLASEAIRDMELVIGKVGEIRDAGRETKGVEIVQDGWERSNYFVELRRWSR